MLMYLRHSPWQIQVLILIICILVMIPNLIKMSKRVPKIATIAFSTLTLAMLNLIFAQLGKNMGDSIGITAKHVEILDNSVIVLFLLSMILIFTATYQAVKHDEEKRKHLLRLIWAFIIIVILYIIIILL